MSGKKQGGRRHPAAAFAGFSLIEVALAIALIAFVIVAVLGMIPAGLATSRDSVNETRAAEIAEQVFAVMRRQPFDNIQLFGQTLDAEAASQPGAAPLVLALSAGEVGDVRPPEVETNYQVVVTLSTPAAVSAPGRLAEVRVAVTPRAGRSEAPIDFITLISSSEP